jgi:hypothetical protein
MSRAAARRIEHTDALLREVRRIEHEIEVAVAQHARHVSRECLLAVRDRLADTVDRHVPPARHGPTPESHR